MGRIKTKLVQSITDDLIKKHGEKLSKDVNQNKVVVREKTDIFSKKIRNAVAGLAARRLK